MVPTYKRPCPFVDARSRAVSKPPLIALSYALSVPPFSAATTIAGLLIKLLS